LRGEGGAGPARHEDPDDHRAHLAHHRDADEVGDVEVGAEQAQLDGADEGQDQADDQAEERDDRERLGAGGLDEVEEIGAAELAVESHEATEGEGQLSEELEAPDDALPGLDRARAEARDEAVRRRGRGLRRLDDDLGEAQELADALGKVCAVDLDLPGAAGLLRRAQPGEERRVPLGDRFAVEHDSRRRRGAGELAG
jgi:hypothetical protein